jgi:hypothetical protein
MMNEQKTIRLWELLSALAFVAVWSALITFLLVRAG